MLSMTADDDHPFDPRATSHRHGHRRPDLLAAAGVLRSDSPHAFAAAGPQAARITAPHPVDVLQIGSPLAGYMNWMGRCCRPAWITPPTLPSTWASI